MKAGLLAAALAVGATGVSAKTLTLECGELSGIRFSVDAHGKTQSGPNGFAASHPTIVWPDEPRGAQATISMSDASGVPESDPAITVHVTNESVTWVVLQPKATEMWTYVATNHMLIYSQQSPRSGTDLSETTPGSGASGDVMVTTCKEGLN
ncbi:hypothetical protein [Paraburkholderia youngii]|uniref:hypothetical protein n=1 Tax=Paraburkholderia youngii TaxID=2782701 RepID=UPI001FE4E7E3|nr:hypothetical protein [Paraburkholderia youngii]